MLHTCIYTHRKGCHMFLHSNNSSTGRLRGGTWPPFKKTLCHTRPTSSTANAQLLKKHIAALLHNFFFVSLIIFSFPLILFYSFCFSPNLCLLFLLFRSCLIQFFLLHLLPPGVNPIAVKYIISYNIISHFSILLSSTFISSFFPVLFLSSVFFVLLLAVPIWFTLSGLRLSY
jgi:hypothetical protein